MVTVVEDVVRVRQLDGTVVPMERPEAIRRVLLEEVAPEGFVPSLEEKRAQAGAAFAALEAQRLALLQSDAQFTARHQVRRICENLLSILESEPSPLEAA